MKVRGMNHFSATTCLCTSSPGARYPSRAAAVFDHMAFGATDLPGTLDKLKQHAIDDELIHQLGSRVWQVFFHDPQGAKIELDFPEESLSREALTTP